MKINGKVRQKKKGVGKRQPMPPITKRWCLACEKYTQWKYSPMRCHSICLNCGGTRSCKSDPNPHCDHPREDYVFEESNGHGWDRYRCKICKRQEHRWNK